MKKARSFWLRRGAATIFVAACAVFFSACDNLAGIMEWPAHLEAGRYAVGGGDIGAGGGQLLFTGDITITVTGIPAEYDGRRAMIGLPPPYRPAEGWSNLASGTGTISAGYLVVNLNVWTPGGLPPGNYALWFGLYDSDRGVYSGSANDSRLMPIVAGNNIIPWSVLDSGGTGNDPGPRVRVTIENIPPEFYGRSATIRIRPAVAARLIAGDTRTGGVPITGTAVFEDIFVFQPQDEAGRYTHTFVRFAGAGSFYVYLLISEGLYPQSSWVVRGVAEHYFAGEAYSIDFEAFGVGGIIGPPVFTVTFDGNGHTGGTAPNSIFMPSGSITLPDAGSLVRTGYRFEGWNTQPDGMGTHYSAGSAFTVTGNITLYAQWVEDQQGGPDPLCICRPDINDRNEFTLTRLQGGYEVTGWTGSGSNLIMPSCDGAGRYVVSIATGVFFGRGLANVILPDSLVSIGVSAFRDNQLTLVVIPNSVTFIGDLAFSGNQLTSVVIPDGVTSIESHAFSSNQLTSVVIPDSVTTIGSGAFWGNRLENVNLGNGITVIGDSAFRDNQLTSVVIPSSVATIGPSAFETNQLTSVVIPESVNSIRNRAFAENQLTSITIPSGVDIADDWSMGDYGESFLEFYNNTGRRAGTYTWDGTRWLFGGDDGGAAFQLAFAGFTDAAAGVVFDQSVSVVEPSAYITATGASFEDIRWIHDGAIVPNVTGPTLDFSALHGNRIGTHFVTIEVRIGGRWYSRTIRINVTMF